MPVQTPDQFADLVFPRRGISLSQGFAGQLPGTTPLGVNVRTFEALTQRGRGGSRPGLSQYIPQQLPSGAHVVQHLNVIVDPSGDGLADIDDGDFPDPSDAGPSYAWGFGISSRNPGRRIRRGGNGSMRFKNKKLVLTITAAPIIKVQGQTYTFTGNEFVAAGLQIADSISSLTLNSDGAAAGAAAGAYPIVPSAAVIAGPGRLRYATTYVNGVLTVQAALLTGTRYQFDDGDHTWFVLVVPDGALPLGQIDQCGGTGQTFQQEITNGYLQHTTPGEATNFGPGVYCVGP